ncbi:hypothetical protein JX266_012711 [Neoarthrinium moseri]|uniref:uncharacterized protein n=1 Tax=Neoarthrinium moseri TaxID=1658444 RepID=UPI001FDD85B3|nr:uncharacterized protein JN550_013438 [Neoarthrinium moseri]KAI1841118.1 hypothetical protein JX266_012711 [Neoarthrinium moseri]KAI1857201.1 hypothetical protein JN550_013438 [Neoarthrinium moseri]
MSDETGLLAEPAPGTNSEAATSVRGPSVRRERSLKFREFGLYASRVSSATKPTAPAPPVPAALDPNSYCVDEGDDSDYSTTFTSPSPSPYSTATYETNSTQYEPAPRSPISPRWDSLAHSTTVLYDRAYDDPAPGTALATSSPVPSTPTRSEHPNHTLDFLGSESRDAFPLPMSSPTTKMSTYEGRPVVGDSPVVENFSRPRRPSIKHPSPDSLRQRATNVPATHPDQTHLDTLSTPHHHLWPRERGQSISSNKSASTFASLPVRPSPDLHARDSLRGRSRHAYPPLARPAIAYGRTESSGPAFYRDPIPRMASLPSEELRSSFRSQLSASTTPGTLQTERSSVMTKSSSITSIYAHVDDGFSVDDVMGMYEKGFRDDSPARTDQLDDDSRPPTAKSELSRRRTAMLEALSDSLPIQFADADEEQAGEGGAVDTNAADDLEPLSANDDDGLAATPDSAAAVEASELAPFVDHGRGDTGGQSRHDSGKVIDNDDDEFPTRLQKQQTQPTVRMSFENTDVTRDQYGFRKENQYVTQQQYDNWNEGYSEYIGRRRKKWNAFLKENGLMTDQPNRFPPRSAKTKRFVRKGIPPEWRGAAWFYYAGGPAILAKHGGVYDELLRQKAKDVDNEAIERDLHRTFPDNLKFRTANASSAPNTERTESRSSETTVTEPTGNDPRPNETAMISSLRRVLHAFSIYNPRIGYCQSLNFLAGLLLLFTESEEHAFWLLNIITRVYLPGTHEMSLEGANVDLGVLMTSLQESMPAVWAKIGGELDGTDSVKPKSRRQKKGTLITRLPPVTLCMTAWFMSCFIGTLPIETTLRVWDVFFYEGSKTLFRIALAIFKLGENEIRSVGDPMEIFQVVQTIPRRLLDANGLMEACFKRRNGFGHLSQDTIEERRQQRRVTVKLEKERMAAGLTGGDDSADFKRKNTLFAKMRRPAEVM